MEPGREAETPVTADETPMPIRVDLGVPSVAAPVAPAAPPVPETPDVAFVLQQIAATNGPWFPGKFATENNVPRDSLDDPLAELRVAGLVLATEWVRGVGQGYALTPAGKLTAADAAALERLRQGTPAADVATIASAARAPSPGGAAPDAAEDEDEPLAASDADLTFRPPVVVPALLMTNAVWFFLCAVWGIRWGLTLGDSLWRGHPEVLHRFGAVRGTDLLAGEWWRLFTCCFVHIGALHLLGNMFALAMMGPLAELLWGRGRLLLLYAISGLAGSALAMAIRPDSLLAGASGAIWGIQMSLFVWLFTFRDRLPTDVAADWFRRLTVVFLLSAAVSVLPNVSWEGHLGGGLAGFATAVLLNATRADDRARRLAAWLALALLPALCVAGLAGAMGAKGMPAWQRLHKQLTAEREVERWSAAQAEYNAEVAPRLAALAPTGLHMTKVGGRLVNLLPDEREAVLLLRDPMRDPARTDAVRQKLQKRKSLADEIVARTGGGPLGLDALDERREHTHRFAAARAKSFERLLVLLDMNGVPPQPAWDAWESSWLAVADLWGDVRRR